LSCQGAKVPNGSNVKIGSNERVWVSGGLIYVNVSFEITHLGGVFKKNIFFKSTRRLLYNDLLIFLIGVLTMTQTYKELLQQREALELAIAQARQNEISSAVTKVRELAAEFGLTAQDIFPGRGGKTGAVKVVSKVAAKYRDAATGQTWTGRGKAPKWIEGKDRTPFVIA
jgi:DNA-binding protein H-NS